MERNDAITTLEVLKTNCSILSREYQAFEYAISSLKTDEAYQIMYEGGEIFTKADMVAMLDELKKEMNPIKECEYQIYGKEHWNFVGKCQDAIQQKIDSLKSESEDNK